MQHLSQQKITPFDYHQKFTPTEHQALTVQDNEFRQHLGRSSKIQRAQLACDDCRLRKRKCDETRPSCGFCHQNNLPCNYQRVNTVQDKSRVPTAVLNQLEALREEMRVSSQHLDRKLDRHQREITAALGINFASRSQGLLVVQPAHYVGDGHESPELSCKSLQRVEPKNKDREIHYRCSEAPITRLQPLGPSLLDAVQKSQQWEFEQCLTGSTTDCVNALVPRNKNQDISITLLVGHEDGLGLIEMLGLKVLKT